MEIVPLEDIETILQEITNKYNNIKISRISVLIIKIRTIDHMGKCKDLILS